jgi:hypothetical protein
MPIRQLSRVIALLFISILVVSLDGEPGDLFFDILGSSTNSDPNTIWGALNKRCNPNNLEQKALFGEWNGRSNKTIFGRVNNLMDALSVCNKSLPTFKNRLKDDSDSLLNFINSGEFVLGNWFDRSDSCFGRLYELSLLLLPNELDSVLGYSPYIEIAQAIINTTLPYADTQVLKNCISLTQLIHTDAESSENQIMNDRILELLKLLFPIYLDVVIGSTDTPEDEQVYAPLFARLHHLEAQSIIDAATGLAVADRLTRLKAIHPKSIDQFLDYFALVNGVGERSLVSCMANEHSIGSPFNISGSSANTFFVVFDEIASKCRSKEEKFYQLVSTLGTSSNTPLNNTVFGKLASVAGALPSSLVSTFKRFWLGEYPLVPEISLFSNLIEFDELLREHKDALSERAIDQMIQLIGILGDSGTSSLFGAISSIHNSGNFEDFAHSFGFDKDADLYNGNGDEPGSCFYFVNMLKKLTIPKFLQYDLTLCPNLHASTISRLIANAGEDDLPHFIQEDCTWRLNNLIFPQIQKLRAMVSCQETLSYIGDPKNTDYNQLNISSKIHRLIKNLTTKTLTLDWKQIYSMLFFGPNSLQSKIYEIYTHAKHGSFENLIGSMLSRDYSLFGLINKCLHKMEVEPLLGAFCPYISADDGGQIKGAIVRNLVAVCPNLVNDADYKTITQIIGEAYRPHQISVATLTDMIGFFYDTLAYASSFFSFDELERYTKTVFDDATGLLAKSNALLECENGIGVTNITGLMFSVNDAPTMCQMCIQMYRDIFDYVRNVVVDQSVASLNTVEHEGLFCKFLSKYQSQVELLDAFIVRTIKENMKFNIVECLRQIFESGYSTQLAVSDFSFLTVQHSEPSNTYFLLRNIAVNSLEATLQRANDEFARLMHTLIVSPYINLLTNDIHKESETLEDTLYVNEGMLCPAYSSVVSWISYIAKRIPSLDPIYQRRIGDRTDCVDRDGVERLSVFSLFNEILRIISSPSFFLASAQNLSDGLSHWLLALKPLIGTCYNAGSTTSERTLFETLKQLVLLLDSPDVENQQETIANTIGNENINRDSAYKSLFSILEAILKRLVGPYAAFTLDYNAQEINVGTSLGRVYELFKSIGYQNVSSFQALKQVGEPSVPSGFFYQLQECILAFQRDAHLKLLPMSLFLAYSKALDIEIQDFISKMQAPVVSSEVDTFIRNVELFISKMLSLGECDGCRDVVEFLRQACVCINDAAQSLSGVSNDDLITIFSNTSFNELRKAVVALSQAIGDLKQKVILNDGDKKLCIVRDSGEEFAAIYEKIGLVQSAIYAFGSVPACPFSAFSVNSMCQSLPDVITALINAMNGLSLQLRTPVVRYVEYNEQNVKDFADVVSSTLDIFYNVQHIIGLQNCVSCQDSVLGTDLLLDAMRRFIQKLMQINDFIENSYTSQLAYQLYKVAQVVKKTSAHLTTIPLTKNAPREIWQVIAANLEVTSKNIQRVFTALNDRDNFQSIISAVGALYKQLNENFLNLVQMGVGKGLDVLPDAEPDAHGAALMPVALDCIVDSLNHILQYWTNSDARIPLEDNWIVPIVESICQSYLSIEATLNQNIQNISYWAEEYNLTDKIALIRTLLSQRIGPAIDDAVVDLKELCGRNFTEQVATLACRISEFCSMFEQIDPTDIWRTPGNIEAFLLMWAAKAQEIATILEGAAQTTLAGSNSCTHFAILEGMNNLLAVVADECAEASQILPIPAPASRPSSLVDAIAMMTATLGAGNTWWQDVFGATRPIDSCKHALSSALMRLRDSYASIAHGVATITAVPMCMYEDMPLGDIAQLFDARGVAVGQTLQHLNSDLACRRHICWELNAIERAIRNISSNAITTIESVGFGGLIPYVSTLPECFREANLAIQTLLAFFDEAKEGACIDPAAALLAGLHAPLERIAWGVHEEYVAPEPHEFTKSIQGILDAVSSISQRLLLESLDFEPTVLGGLTVIEEAQKLQSHISDVMQILSELSTSTELLNSLADSISSVAPMFSSCFPKLGDLVGSVQLLSCGIENISIAVQNVYEKTVDLCKQLEMVANDESVTQWMHCGTESQRQWLARVEDNSQILSESLNEMRNTIGYSEFAIETTTFQASGGK